MKTTFFLFVVSCALVLQGCSSGGGEVSNAEGVQKIANEQKAIKSNNPQLDVDTRTLPGGNTGPGGGIKKGGK